jgi:glutaredoxin 1
LITIYGKPNCGFCKKATDYCTKAQMEYKYIDVSVGQQNLEELHQRLTAPARSVPQIFIDKNHIGGYTDFIKYVENTGYNGTGYSL